MARYTSKNKISAETRHEAMTIAKGTQSAGQAKAQTKLIAQGIERGIDLYKKQRKEDGRDRDRRQRDKRQQAGKSTGGISRQLGGVGPRIGDPVAALATPRGDLDWYYCCLLGLESGLTVLCRLQS